MDDQNDVPVPPYNPNQESDDSFGRPATPMMPDEIEPATAQQGPSIMPGSDRPMTPGDVRTESSGQPLTSGAQPPAFGSDAQQDQVPVPQPVQNVEAPRPKRKKWPIIAGVIGVIVLLLGAGSVFAYTWYQNPQRVLMDGLAKALQAKSLTHTGTVTVTDPTEKMSVRMDIKGAAASGQADLDVTAVIKQEDKEYKLHGGGVYDDKGNVYVRFQDVAQTVDSVIKNVPEMNIPPEAQPMIDKLVAKIDNRWIKISASDIEGYSKEGSDAMTCISDATESLRNDQKVRQELADTYQKNPFITIDEELGTKNGSMGYAISPDMAKEKAFLTDFKNTTIYKKLVECNSKDFEMNLDNFDITEDTKGRVEVWLSQWQHEITQVNIQEQEDDGTKMDASWLPVFNKPVTIAVPSDTTTLSELQADVEEIFNEYMMSQMQASPDASAADFSREL